MKSVRNRIANEIQNHELLQNANTTIDRVPLSDMTNQLNKSALLLLPLTVEPHYTLRKFLKSGISLPTILSLK